MMMSLGRVRVLNELKDVERVIVIEVHPSTSKILMHLSLLLADRSRLAIDTLQDDLHHGHLAVCKGPQLKRVLADHAVSRGKHLPSGGRRLEPVDDALAVRIFLFMKLSLDLLRVEKLKRVRLEVEAGKGLEMLRSCRILTVLAVLIRIWSAVICQLRAVFVVFNVHILRFGHYLAETAASKFISCALPLVSQLRLLLISLLLWLLH